MIFIIKAQVSKTLSYKEGIKAEHEQVTLCSRSDLAALCPMLCPTKRVEDHRLKSPGNTHYQSSTLVLFKWSQLSCYPWIPTGPMEQHKGNPFGLPGSEAGMETRFVPAHHLKAQWMVLHFPWRTVPPMPVSQSSSLVRKEWGLNSLM